MVSFFEHPQVKLTLKKRRLCTGSEWGRRKCSAWVVMHFCLCVTSFCATCIMINVQRRVTVCARDAGLWILNLMRKYIRSLSLSASLCIHCAFNVLSVWAAVTSVYSFRFIRRIKYWCKREEKKKLQLTVCSVIFFTELVVDTSSCTSWGVCLTCEGQRVEKCRDVARPRHSTLQLYCRQLSWWRGRGREEKQKEKKKKKKEKEMKRNHKIREKEDGRAKMHPLWEEASDLCFFFLFLFKTCRREI